MRHMLGDSALGIRSRLHRFEWPVIGDRWFAVLFQYVAETSVQTINEISRFHSEP